MSEQLKIFFLSYTHGSQKLVTYRHLERVQILPLTFPPFCSLTQSLLDLSSTSNCSGCLDVTLYSEEISRLKREFEDIQRMILGQEQVLCGESQNQLVLFNQESKPQRYFISKDIKQILRCQLFKTLYSLRLHSFVITHSLIPAPLQVLDQASQTQATLKTTSSRLSRDTQNHLMSIKLLNQSLERYLDRVEGWKDVIEETEENMKTLVEDQYDIRAIAQQVNMTVALR